LGLTGYVAVSATPLGKPGIERQYQANGVDNCRKSKEKNINNGLVGVDDGWKLSVFRRQAQTFAANLPCQEIYAFLELESLF